MVIASEDGKGLVMGIPPFSSRAAHFVLLHGIGGGAWCWYKLRCLMESSGYKVTCIDLKSAGIDPSDPDSILSFDQYNQPLVDFLSHLPQDQKVILVGHSAGGLSVTDAIYKFPKKIGMAIYIGATMLRWGFQTDQDIKDGAPDLSEFGDVYEFGYGLGRDHPPTSAIIKKEYQRKIIYHMSPQEDSTLALMLLKPGPLLALLGARLIEGIGADDITRVYIKTMHDQVIKPQQQEAMIQKWPPSTVYTLESDHSPFFSSPFMLFTLLLKAAASANCI
ncbi:PREDICTED: methylesterase 17-like [Nelumbo nucifera]|uniref:AB hydrolase-1 domain-containing protein n=2 Tax=Nelumbo nucifera TaxID=4432 RepID=A0A822Y831_NELNU|nr:PREDICTED: methylesterase 17-like [Nelumbo nucifera]DAD25748.1 TPA_asm: hypothetical protein HUJ06_027216 [Nelumbo nucifera]